MVIQRAVSRGCSTPWEKADAVAGVAPLVASVRDPVERGEFSRRLAFAAAAEPGHVEQAVRAAARGDREGVLAAVAARPRRESPVERNLRTLAQMLIDHPQHAGRLPRSRAQGQARQKSGFSHHCRPPQSSRGWLCSANTATALRDDFYHSMCMRRARTCVMRLSGSVGVCNNTGISPRQED